MDIWESTNPSGFLEKEQDTNENIDFSKYIDKLQPSNYVILAMNPGGDYDEESLKKVTRKAKADGRQWSNFHNRGTIRDFLLGNAITETKLMGTYMTDLFPIVGSNSGEISTVINDKKNIDIIDRLIREFDEEMTCLLPDEPEIKLICLGTYVHKKANKLLVKNPNLNHKYSTYLFPHYSGANCAQVSNLPEDEKRYYPNVVKNKIKEYDLDL